MAMLFEVVDALWWEKINDRSPSVGTWYSVDDERLEALREIVSVILVTLGRAMARNAPLASK